MTSVLWRLIREIRPYKGSVAIVAVSGVIYAAAYSRLGFILKGILDNFERHSQDGVREVALQGLVIAFLVGISRYIHVFTMNMTAEKVVNDLRLRLQRKFMGLSVGFHSNYQGGSGGLMSRILNDVKVIQDGLRMVADLFIYPLLALLLVGNLFLMNAGLTAVILFVLPVILWFLRQISRSLRKSVLLGQENLEDITSTIKESLDGVRTIQSFNLQGMMADKLRELSDRYLSIRRRFHSHVEVMGPVTEFAATVIVLGIFMYFGSEVAKGNFTSGGLVAYVSMLLMINPPLKKLQESYVRVQETIVAATRTYDLLDEASEVPRPPAPRPFPADWSVIRYRNVSFSYVSQPTLTDVNLEVRRGEQVAFVGESGSGKSTLINLLGRFHDPSSGQILVDDTDIRDFDLEDLRRHISLVSQDVFLFSDTVQKNIQAGDLSRGPDGVRESARSANADDFIGRLPKGYSSRVGERGSLLSGGEKQRVGIARALFKNAPILILDEATSALDSGSEKEVQKGLEQLMKGRTSFVVAHRLSTVQNAHRIYVMQGGRIVAQGRHDDLLTQSPIYARAWSLQTAQAEAAPRS